MNNMNKGELVSVLNKKTGLKTDKFVNALIETVTETLASGENIQLIGFGTFEVRQRSERKARNPKTGETMTIPAQKAPTFKPGKGLKTAVNK